MRAVPDVEFKCRELGGWVTKTSDDYFRGKRVVLFSLPGAFTPTCSNKQLPGYEGSYDNFMDLDIDEVYCISVNDAFVMNAWAADLSITNVEMIPDGSGTFTTGMNMLVDKDDKGFGFRSWRYAAIIDDCMVEKLFEEPGKDDNCADDPYGESSPENIITYLENNND